MKISIIICTYNRVFYLSKCLEHLKNQSSKPDDYEVVIVDNNSTDKTAEISKKFISENPHLFVKYIFESNSGLSHARNRGINESIGEVICFIDDDGFIFPEYIQNLKSCLINNPKINAFGGKIYPMYESSPPKWMTRWLQPLLSVIDKGNNIVLFKGTHYPIGANMGFKRNLINKIGLFNTDLGRKGNSLLGGEEKDYFFKIKKIKEPIFFLPNVKIHHIIPDNRVTESYIRRMGIGIGISERIRTIKNNKFVYIISILKEIIKWIVTLILAIIYLFSFWGKSYMLIRFRYWVTLGLLNLKKEI
jgi:glycosyltransferase involved in cell wall biosynthesis